MRYLLFLFFVPFYLKGQNQSSLSERTIISEFKINENKSINIRKSNLVFKDNKVISEMYHRQVFEPNDTNIIEVLKDYEDFLNLAIEAWKDISDSTGFFNTNEVTDSTQYIGSWRLNVKGQITNGKVKINANDKFIFDPNLNQARTENLPLNFKTNLIRINVDGVKYLLIKNESGKAD